MTAVLNLLVWTCAAHRKSAVWWPTASAQWWPTPEALQASVQRPGRSRSRTRERVADREQWTADDVTLGRDEGECAVAPPLPSVVTGPCVTSALDAYTPAALAVVDAQATQQWFL